jgi:hypothetical protein
MQICKYCSIEKSLPEFRTKRVKSKDYLAKQCRTCESKVATDKTTNDLNRYLSRLLSHKRRKLFEISKEELRELYDSQKGLCAITKVPMTNIHGQGKVYTNISMDRIQAGGPYTKDNVRLVCNVVNLMRLQNTDEQFKWWCQKVVDEINV